MKHAALETFSPAVRGWFEQAFAAPTRVQELAWPAISSGEHVLIAAPTGSGKTLAAFLWALDQLMTQPSQSELTNHGHTRLVYVSPLKALSYDVEKNLRTPLRGILAAQKHHLSPSGLIKGSLQESIATMQGAGPTGNSAQSGVRVAVRTGDTPQAERRDMLRNPPDILITTPESLYLMLTSQAKKMFVGTEWIIIDEIHAVAQSKRGAHLAITLERLCEQAERNVQRIGLSATQRPLDEVGRFLVGPQRECTLVDTKTQKQLDLKITVPVESLTEPWATSPSDSSAADIDPFAGQEATRRSIWPVIYPELLDLVEQHHSTLVFVNNRRAAERLALRLNELATKRAAERLDVDVKPRQPLAVPVETIDKPNRPTQGSSNGSDPHALIEVARAHHGSLAREQRTLIEDQLKAGTLPCLIATSSLELGIDMGAIDLVVQIESPKSVTRGMQRVGRSGHSVDEVAKGRIFPKFRADLLECAVVVKRMREGLIETTVIPRNPLDVLAQQIVAMAAANEDGISVDELFALVTRTYTYSDLSQNQLENVLDMLDGRYPSEEFAELRSRIVWDRIGGTVRARRGARQLAIANAGTIPDRGLYSVNLPDGRRVGELDEEMVYEARPGQVFLLGASSWRIEEITRDRVIVTPAPGVPGAVPFWKGEGIGRPRELGEAIGAFSRWAVGQDPEVLERDYDLDKFAANNLLEFLLEQEQATRVIPSDRTIVVERFRDEIGDWRLCILSPYGGRVHAAWGLALSARIRDRYGLEADAIWSDDGIIVHLPDADEPPGADLVLVDPDEVEDIVVGELGSSALFGARFRENAARALLLPRAYPGRRTPLWQQRLKAQSLLEVAHRFPQFPIVLETYRECLRDVLDVPGLTELLRQLHTRELNLVEVETATASPFASSLLFDYVATYMYEGDTPNAERRAAALALDRDLLRELLGQEELRDLIDPEALNKVEEDLQGLSENTQAKSVDMLHDLLRRIGDLTLEEAAARTVSSVDQEASGSLDVHPTSEDVVHLRSEDASAHSTTAAEWLLQLKRERRAVKVRIAGEERWIAAEDAGLYRDALGVIAPPGLPEVFVEEVPDALVRLTRRYLRTHGPFETHALYDRYGVDFSAVLKALEVSGELIRGELRPGGVDREWCDPEILRRIRRGSLAALRSEIEPAEQRAYARFATSWQGIDRHPSAGAGIDRLREVLVPLQGLALPVELWERDILPRRLGAYSPTWIDQLCAAGELVWVGAGALGRYSGRVALYFRSDVAALGPPLLTKQGENRGFLSSGRGHPIKSSTEGDGKSSAIQDPNESHKEAIRAQLERGACFFTDLLSEQANMSAAELQEALWDLVWAGEITNDAFTPLRATRPKQFSSPPTRLERSGRRFGHRRGAQTQIQGRWSLTKTLFSAVEVDFTAQRRTHAELLLERYGIVTREQVLAEGIPGGFAGLYDQFSALETLGVARRGYFIEGLGGAQFALPGAVERLRASDEGIKSEPLVIAAADPAQPYGASLKWPDLIREDHIPGEGDGQQLLGESKGNSLPKGSVKRSRLARVAGAYVVLDRGNPVLYVERGGKGIIVLDYRDTERLSRCLTALVTAVKHGQVVRLGIERINGQPAAASPLFAELISLGFSSGPRKLTLRKSL